MFTRNRLGQEAEDASLFNASMSFQVTGIWQTAPSVTPAGVICRTLGARKSQDLEGKQTRPGSHPDQLYWGTPGSTKSKVAPHEGVHAELANLVNGKLTVAETDYVLKQVEIDDSLMPCGKTGGCHEFLTQKLGKVDRPVFVFTHRPEIVLAGLGPLMQPRVVYELSKPDTIDAWQWGAHGAAPVWTDTVTAPPPPVAVVAAAAYVPPQVRGGRWATTVECGVAHCMQKPFEIKVMATFIAAPQTQVALNGALTTINSSPQRISKVQPSKCPSCGAANFQPPG